MWPFKRKPPPLPIPKFRPPEPEPPKPVEPMGVTEAPGEWSMRTISMKIRKYWNIGE